MLSWRDADASMRIHNRWAEPATFKRVGNCMIEFCPVMLILKIGAYSHLTLGR